MFAEDLEQFFETEDFGEEAIWSQGSVTVQVLFNNEYESVLDVATTRPQCWVRDAQMPDLAREQFLTIRSATYRIVNVQPDGTGLSLLELSKT